MNMFSVKRMIVSLISGLLFGSGMIISGMVDPNKVVGFLNVTGAWDPSLIFVLGGALLVFTPIYHLAIKHREKALNGDVLSLPTNKKIDSNLMLGAVMFGAGWGLVGFCPGPIVASLSSGNVVVFIFMMSMIVGMTIANKYLSKNASAC